MESGIIGFAIGSISGLILCFSLIKMMTKAKVSEMISETTEKKIIDLEFDKSFLEKKLSIAIRERDIAIEDSKLTLKERNEALIMLSNKF